MPKAQSMVMGEGLCCNPTLNGFIKYLIGSRSQGPIGGFSGLVDRMEVAVGRMGET